jgi:hypothetical protein
VLIKLPNDIYVNPEHVVQIEPCVLHITILMNDGRKVVIGQDVISLVKYPAESVPEATRRVAWEIVQEINSKCAE